MTPIERAASHRYEARVSWQGTTGAGYRGYSRDHVGETGAGVAADRSFRLSADPTFRGNPALPNPEELLVLAASSCQLLSFLARAARAGVDVLGYADDAVGLMPAGDGAMPTRIESIVLRPVITVAAGTDPGLVTDLAEEAHHACYIANSLVTDVALEPTVTVS